MRSDVYKRQDPRYDGGKLNQLTKEKGEDLVEYIPDFMGEDYLYYRSPGMNVALLRGTSADPHGNISCCLLYTSRCV